MPTIQHAYNVGDRVVLTSGRSVLITRCRKTPGADVNFAPIRNQPWYDGRDAGGNKHTFPQTSIVQVFAEGYPKDVPGRVRRVLAEKAARKRNVVLGSLTITWAHEEDENSERNYRHQGEVITQQLLNDAPAGVSNEVFNGLLEFAVNCGEFPLLPDEVKPAIRRYLKKVRANQAALR